MARSEPASPPPAGGEPRGRLDTTGKRGGQILLHRTARLFGEKNDFFMYLKAALNPTLLTYFQLCPRMSKYFKDYFTFPIISQCLPNLLKAMIRI